MPYHTVYDYLKGVTPHEHRRSQIERGLRWLEQAVERGRFPLALSVRQKDRPAHILAIRARYAR